MIETDPDIGISISAEIKENKINNIEKILLHTANKKANHGEGKSIRFCFKKRINFISAYKFAKSIQEKGNIPYGPFEPKGSNCARFVASIIRKSEPSFIKKLKLNIIPNLSIFFKRNVSLSKLIII